MPQITGTSSDDVLLGAGLPELIEGLAGNDTLDGGNSIDNDTLDGGEGNDVLKGGPGQDHLTGGLGVDWFIFTEGGPSNADIVTDFDVANELILLGRQYFSALTTDGALSDTNFFSGPATSGNFTGVGASHHILHDTLTGDLYYDSGGVGDADKVLFATLTNVFSLTENSFRVFGSIYITNASQGGGNFDDLLIGSHADNIFGGITGGLGNDSIFGNGGNDSLVGDGGDDTISGGAGNDTLNGGDGEDELDGGDGNDSLLGGADNDILSGGAGNDTLNGGTGEDELDGGDGNDSLLGGADNDTISGGAGNDTLNGGAGADELDGGDGDDRFINHDVNGLHGDIIAGGAGSDTLDYIGVEVNLEVALAEGNDFATVFGGTKNDVISGIEHLYGGKGNDTFTGNCDINLLNGGIGDDILRGKGGSDSLYGGDGHDTFLFASATELAEDETISGGDGNDTIEFTAAADIVDNDFTLVDTIEIIKLADGTNTLVLGAKVQAATGAGILTVTGGTGDDTIDASALDEELTINAGNGDNVLTGSTFADTITSGSGNDTITGGAGIDSLTGGAGNDTYIYTLTDNFIEGNEVSDYITDSDGTDRVLISGAISIAPTASLARADGVEQIVAAMDGGTRGHSIVIGDDSKLHDVRMIDLSGSSDPSSTGSVNLSNVAPSVAITGVLAGNNTLTGGSGNDTITGGSNADTLTGGSGNDILTGGAGVDSVSGGAGNDTVNVNGAHDSGAEVLHGGDDIDVLAVSGQSLVIAATATVRDFETITLAEGINLTLPASLLNENAIATVTGTANGGVELVTFTDASGGNTISLSDILSVTHARLAVDAGDGDDAVTGSNFSDSLIGGLGNDTLSGGTGNDTLLGGDGDDNLDGGDGDDSLNGGLGNDTLIGGLGDDTLNGGADNDTVSYASSTAGVTIDLTIPTAQTTTGGAGADTLISIENLIGSGFDDTLTGDTGPNVLDGGDGDDTLIGGAGIDSLMGGAGNDTYIYANNAEFISGNMVIDVIADSGGSADRALIGGAITIGASDSLQRASGIDQLVAAENPNDLLTHSIRITTNVELKDVHTINLSGSSNSSSTGTVNLTGVTHSVTITGVAAGENTLTGGSGDDTITGGSGSDTITGGAGIDSIDAGAGDDTVNVSGTNDSGNETLKGGDGTDVLAVFGLNLVIAPGATLSGFEKIELADGIDLTMAASKLGTGSNGNDISTVTGVSGGHVETVTFTGTGAADTIVLTGIGSVTDARLVVDAGAGDDQVMASGVGSVLNGDAGNDTLFSGAGDDTLDGGADTDTVSYANAASAVTVYLSITTSAQDTGGGNDDWLISIENLIGSNYADTLSGDGNANKLDGGGGDDILDGGEGNDTLLGGLGNDSFLGGIGEDSVDGGAGDDTLNGGAGHDILTGGDGADQFVFNTAYNASNNVETITDFTLGHGDKLVFSNSIFTALTGVGALQSSRFRAGEFDTAGDADDFLIYDTRDGKLYYDADGSRTSVQATPTHIATLQGIPALTPANVGSYIEVIGTVHHTLTGGTGNDMLFGGNGNDLLSGGNGNDTLDGGDGIDTLVGGFGDDLYYVNHPDDVVTEAGTNPLDQGADTLYSTASSYVMPANVGRGEIKTSAGASLTANDFGNTLIGDIGNDTLIGGAGNDTLTGGLGNDRFVFNTTPADPGNRDTVTDFSLAHDKLVLDNSVFTALPGGTLDPSMFHKGGGVTTAADANDYIIYNTSTGELFYDADGTGPISKIRFATLTGDPDGLLASHIEVINGTLTGDNGPNMLSGGVGDDTISGLGGNDTLIGGAGNDSLSGGAGNDSLVGGDGNDTLDGGTGNDTMIGGAGNDIYYVDSSTDVVTEAVNGGIDHVYSTASSFMLGANVENATIATADPADITGNSLDNYIYAGSGDNVISGGAGIDSDWVSYKNAATGVTVSLAVTTMQLTGGSGNDTLNSIENLYGSAHNDTLTGGDGDNELDGGAGDDSLIGGNGDDTLIGGAGNDTLIGGDGNDHIYAGAGNDSMDGGDGVDGLDFEDYTTSITVNLMNEATQNSGAGIDIIVNIEHLRGGSADDHLTGNNADNWLIGGGGNDTLLGGVGADTLQGGLGDDELTGGAGADRFLFYSTPGPGNYDAITDWDNNSDKIALHVESFPELGGSGPLPAAYFRAGSAAIDANDYIIYDVATGILYYDADGVGTNHAVVPIAVLNTKPNLSADDFEVGAEKVTIEGGSGNDELIGSAAEDFLFAGAGDDLIDGGPGNDFLEGGTGNDTIRGGAGIDTASYASAGGNTVLELGRFKGSDGDNGNDTIEEIENLTGSPYNDIIIGNEVSNVLKGENGDDILYGYSGADSLYGGDGNDWLRGGMNSDYLDGGSGNDVVDYANATSAITASLMSNTVTYSGGSDTLVSIESVRGGSGNDTLTGNNSKNRLEGGAGNDNLDGLADNDVLLGGKGNDTLFGGGGDDTLMGGPGNDILDGGADTDSASYIDAGSAVTVSLAIIGSSQNTGGGGHDTLSHIENLEGSAYNDTLTGNTGDNVLYGRGGADILSGGDGMDVLVGGAGNDTLTGGSGMDHFVFDTAPGAKNVDRITDFVAADDTLVFEYFAFGGLSYGTLPAGQLVLVSSVVAAADSNDYFIFNTSNGDLYYDQDGSGTAHSPQLIVKLVGVTTLSYTDIHVTSASS